MLLCKGNFNGYSYRPLKSYEERSIHGPWLIVTREVKNEFLANKTLLLVAFGFVLVPNTLT